MKAPYGNAPPYNPLKMRTHDAKHGGASRAVAGIAFIRGSVDAELAEIASKWCFLHTPWQKLTPLSTFCPLMNAISANDRLIWPLMNAICAKTAGKYSFG